MNEIDKLMVRLIKNKEEIHKEYQEWKSRHYYWCTHIEKVIIGYMKNLMPMYENKYKMYTFLEKNIIHKILLMKK